MACIMIVSHIVPVDVKRVIIFIDIPLLMSQPHAYLVRHSAIQMDLNMFSQHHVNKIRILALTAYIFGKSGFDDLIRFAKVTVNNCYIVFGQQYWVRLNGCVANQKSRIP